MWKSLRRWLDAIPIDNALERRQAQLVQIILLGLAGVFLVAASITLVAAPFTQGALRDANLQNSVANLRSFLFVLVPLVLLRRGAFRAAVAVLMVELFLLAFSTFYQMGPARGWLAGLMFALPLSLAALVLGRRALLLTYVASVAVFLVAALAHYPLLSIDAQNAPSVAISFALIAGLLSLFLDSFGAAFRRALMTQHDAVVETLQKSLASKENDLLLLALDITKQREQRTQLIENLKRSEDRFAKAFQANPAAMVISRLHDGAIVDVNASYEQIMGYSRDELVGRTALELDMFDDPEQRADYVARLREHGTLRGYELDIRAKDGRIVHALFSMELIDLDGVTCLLSSMYDITERTIAERRLLESQERLSSIIESAMDAIITVDEEQTIVLVNKAAETIFRAPSTALVGKPLDMLIPPRYRSAHRAHIARFGASGITTRTMGQTPDLMGLRADGTEFPIEASISQVEVGGSKLYTAIVRDISSRRAAEQRTRQLTEALPLIVWTATPDGEADYLNRCWFEYTGQTDGEPLGWGWATAVHADDRERCIAAWSLSVGEGIAYHIEHRLRRADGTYQWFLAHAEPVRTDDGAVLWWVGTATNIDDLKQAEQRMRFVLHAGELFAQASDLQSILNAVTQLACPEIADWCTVQILNKEGRPETVALAHKDPEKVAWAWELQKTLRPYDPEAPRGVAHVIRTGQSEFYETIPDALLVESARDEADLALMRSVGLSSAIVAPLAARNEVIGVITFVHADSGRHFTRNDVALAEEIGRRAGLAIEKAQLYQELAGRERRYAALIQHTWEAIALFSAEGTILYGSPTTERVLGYTEGEFVGISAFDIIHPEDAPAVLARLKVALEHPNTMVPVSARVRHKDGSWRYLDGVFNNLLHDEAIAAIVNNYRDTTEQRRLQQQFLQAQKMEVVGRLAGGVAHDFNNVLTAILGLVELCLMDETLSAQTKVDLLEVQRSARRATNLTRQLLTFARQQILELRVLNLNDLIVESGNMLRRLIGEHIELAVTPGDDLWLTRLDAGQLEQVIVNLVVNAKDAMPQGGRLTIETANVELGDDYTREHAYVIPGAYVMLAVSDTGTGMPPDVREQAFEPFFTTKEPGKGTGLGLATCYGIVKQHAGYIWIYSEVGQGTAVKCYFPAVRDEAASLPDTIEPQDLPRGDETILIAEDEPQVRMFAVRVLKQLGYTVYEAENGEQALMLLRSMGGKVDLLITDVIMPLMGGKALAERMTAIWPQTRVMFISGYTDNTITHSGILEPGLQFLQKPFTMSRLARKVREVLDGAWEV